MVRISDCSSDHVAHAWRKIGLLLKNNPICDCSRSKKNALKRWKKTEMALYMRTYFRAIFKYKYHGLHGRHNKANTLPGLAKILIIMYFWLEYISKWISTYWVPQKLPQIYTLIAYICVGKVAWFAVYICGDIWNALYIMNTRCFHLNVYRKGVEVHLANEGDFTGHGVEDDATVIYPYTWNIYWYHDWYLY